MSDRWRVDALCLIEGHPLALFFPSGVTGAALAQIEQAKAVCHRCEVAQDCLDWALETGQDAGIWGGTTEDDRGRTANLAPSPRPASGR